MLNSLTKKAALLTAVATSLIFGSAAAAAPAPKIGLVDFKAAVEQSKAGKQEQDMYEGMKKQIESILQEKDEEFQRLSKNLKDEDFRDSQKPEALEKMEEQYRSLGQELAQAQSHYYQTLQQANFKIVQKLAELVGQASTTVAENEGLDLILNTDQAFYNAPTLDVTEKVVAQMDKLASDEVAKAAADAPSTSGAQ